MTPRDAAVIVASVLDDAAAAGVEPVDVIAHAIVLHHSRSGRWVGVSPAAVREALRAASIPMSELMLERALRAMK